MIRVYLAGGIAGLSSHEIHHWRDDLKRIYNGDSFEFVDPTDRDYRGVVCDKETSRAIVKIDKLDIQSCQVVIAYCPVPSWGTAMEILYSHLQNKWVIAVCPNKNLSPWIVDHVDVIIHSFNLLDQQLMKIKKEIEHL